MLEWAKKYLGLLVLDENSGHYYLENLYCLFYENMERFNTGDWFAEIAQAVSERLVELKTRSFTPNGGYCFIWVSENFPWHWAKVDWETYWNFNKKEKEKLGTSNS